MLPAPMMLAQAFSARSKLKRWCETKVAEALSISAHTGQLRVLALDSVVSRDEASTVGADLRLGLQRR